MYLPTNLTKYKGNEIMVLKTQGDKMDKINVNQLKQIGQFAVDSGQAMVGDPCYLDQWETNKGEEWNLDGRIGEYSYQGASASMGTLGNGLSVTFPTGYGDGLYPVYAKFNEDGRISKIVIDFFDEEE
jgi:hypothetical protein